jgi:hypothetical protein
MDELFRIVACSKLRIIFHITADDSSLIVNVLNPLDEFVAAALGFSLLRKRRSAGQNKHRSPSTRGIMAIDVDEHSLRNAAGLPIAVSGAHSHHLVRRNDYRWHGSSLRSGLSERFHDAGMIAAEISEDVGDACFRERFENGRARRVQGDQAFLEDCRSFAPRQPLMVVQRLPVYPLADHRV